MNEKANGAAPSRTIGADDDVYFTVTIRMSPDRLRVFRGRGAEFDGGMKARAFMIHEARPARDIIEKIAHDCIDAAVRHFLGEERLIHVKP